MTEIVGQAQQVADRRLQVRRPDDVVVRRAGPPLGAAARVAKGAAGDEHGDVVAQHGVRHAERGEDARRDERGETLARYALDDPGGEEVVGVAVPVLGAGREVQRLLAIDDGRRVGAGDTLFLEAAARDDQQLEEVAQAARVGEQVPDRDRLARVGAVLGEIAEMAPDVVLERELAVAREEQDGERGHLLGERRGVDDGGRRHRYG